MSCQLQTGQIKIFTGANNKINDAVQDTGANSKNIIGITNTLGTSETTKNSINITTNASSMVNGTISNNISDKITSTKTGYIDINGAPANFNKYNTNGVAILGITHYPLGTKLLKNFNIDLNNIKGIILGPATSVEINYNLISSTGGSAIRNQSITFKSDIKNKPSCIAGVPVAKSYYTVTNEDIQDELTKTTHYRNSCPKTGTQPKGCFINHSIPSGMMPSVTSITVKVAGTEHFTIFSELPNNNSIYLILLTIIVGLVLIFVLYKYF